jgi:hypothetical protein
MMQASERSCQRVPNDVLAVWGRVFKFQFWLYNRQRLPNQAAITIDTASIRDAKIEI